ncbi:hypothetical protein ACWEN6_39360 [Sphaerisporangium sp. NPDC004334]
MTTSEHPVPSASSVRRALDGRMPPWWLGLLLVPVDVYLAISLAEKHGLAVGVLAAVVYGALTFVPLFFEEVTAWSRAHPVLDGLVLVPLVFLALAYLTPLSLAMCAAVTAACGLPWPVVVTVLRRRRRRTG